MCVTTQDKLSVSPEVGNMHFNTPASVVSCQPDAISNSRAIFTYPPLLSPALPSLPLFPSSPESPTIFTRLRRALTFLNEKALFAALQQLTIYDNEASLES